MTLQTSQHAAFKQTGKVIVVLDPLGFISETDESNNKFTITAVPTVPPSASVSVISPNGGETYRVGDTVTLRWSTANVPANTSVMFQLSYFTTDATSRMEDGMNTYYPSATDGSFQWTIPAKYGSGYVPGGFRVRAVLSGPSIPGTNPPQDYSDSSFIITAPKPSSPLSATCVGEQINDGMSIKWNSSVGGGTTAPYNYSWSAYNDVVAYTGGSTLSPEFSAKYGSVGTKQAVLRVTDGSGATVTANCSATISNQVTTNPVTPPAVISPVINYHVVSTTSVSQGQTFSWTGVATKGTYPITKYRAYVVGSTRPADGGWATATNGDSVSFNAPSVGTALNPKSFYNGPGSYTLRFEVVDSSGQTVYDDKQLIVDSPPTGMSGSPYTAAILEAISEWYAAHPR